MAGVKLLLTRRGSREVRILFTFSDGAFYLIGVKPGEYELSAEERRLARMGLHGEPLTLHDAGVGGRGDGGRLELRTRG